MDFLTMLFKIICLVLLLVYTPYMTGNIIVRRYGACRSMAGMTFIAGFMIILTLFEVTAVPVIFNVRYGSFRILSVIFSIIMICADTVGTWLWLKDRRLGMRGKENEEPPRGDAAGGQEEDAADSGYSRWSVVMWCIAAVILVYMLVMAVTHAWFDGDDAYYVTQSVITQQTGTMYSIQPYTGGSTAFDLRHVMAAFTMWVAYMSSACGFHAAVFCHTVLPLFLIPLTELIYLETGRRLVGGTDGVKRDILPVFMIFVMLLQIFGSVSIYTSETFFLTRTWQGKSMVANFLFPLLLLIWMEILGTGKDDVRTAGTAGTAAEAAEDKRFWWVMLFLLSSCAGIFSSLAVVLCGSFSGLIALMFAVKRRLPGLILHTACALLPAAVYVVVYLLI